MREPDRLEQGHGREAATGRNPPLSPDVLFPGVAILAVVLVCFVGPLTGLLPKPVGGSVTAANLPMLSVGHPLGTDLNGNDVLSRLVYGGRTSLQIAVCANALGLLLGGIVGALAAQLGGAVDAVISRVLDAVIAYPSLVLALAIAHLLGPGQSNTTLALAVFSIPAFARVSRSATLRVRERPFMVIARLSGTAPARVLFRHIAPNILPQLTTFGLLGIGLAIIIEGALSFLGVGVPPPLPSWGNMIFHGHHALILRPSLVLIPAACLVTTVLSINVLGDALRVKWARG